MKRIVLLLITVVSVNSVLAQFEQDTVPTKKRKPLSGTTWEWKIAGWDAARGHDLVVEFTFFENNHYVKYQRVEALNRAYNKIYSRGTWEFRNDGLVHFLIESKNREIRVNFDPNRAMTLFRYSMYNKGEPDPFKTYTREFYQIPHRSQYPEYLMEFE